MRRSINAAVVALSVASAAGASAGTYGGVFGGYAAVDVTARETTTPQDYDGDGGVVGLQVGHDWLADGWIYGVAGDVAYDFVHASIYFSGGPVVFKTRQEFEGSLRARLGLTGVATSLARGNVPFAQVWEEVDPFGAEAAKKEAQLEERALKRRIACEQVDADEAKWVAQRILADGAVDENEIALLQFLKKEAMALDPALDAVIKRAGL